MNRFKRNDTIQIINALSLIKGSPSIMIFKNKKNLDSNAILVKLLIHICPWLNLFDYILLQNYR